MSTELVDPKGIANLMAAAATMGGAEFDILKFAKGKWLLGQDAEKIPLGTRYAVDMMEARYGWLLWDEGKPADRRVETFVSGIKPPLRSELGHDDKDLWDIDEQSKQPRDPWQKCFEIPARPVDGGEQVVISGGSSGMEGAVSRLLKEFGKSYMQHAGKTAVVELGAGDYKHKNPNYGLIDVPVFTIVDWIDDLGDAAPAEPKSKAKAKF